MVVSNTDGKRKGVAMAVHRVAVRALAVRAGTRIARISAAAACRSCTAAGDADIYGIGFGIQLTAAS